MRQGAGWTESLLILSAYSRVGPTRNHLQESGAWALLLTPALAFATPQDSPPPFLLATPSAYVIFPWITLTRTGSADPPALLSSLLD